MNKTSKITVFIASPHFLLRQGIVRSLAAVRDIEVLGTAEVNNDILSTIDTLLPDVALIDIDGSDIGLTVARKIKQRSPNVGIVLITSSSGDTQLVQAIEAQASGLLNKEVTAAHLVDTVRRVAHGEQPIYQSPATPPEAAERRPREFKELTWHGEAEVFVSRLTRRETDILSHIARGYLNTVSYTHLTLPTKRIV